MVVICNQNQVQALWAFQKEVELLCSFLPPSLLLILHRPCRFCKLCALSKQGCEAPGQ